MHAGKNMGIMTTLEKNLLQKGGVDPGDFAVVMERTSRWTLSATVVPVLALLGAHLAPQRR